MPPLSDRCSLSLSLSISLSLSLSLSLFLSLSHSLSFSTESVFLLLHFLLSFVIPHSCHCVQHIEGKDRRSPLLDFKKISFSLLLPPFFSLPPSLFSPILFAPPTLLPRSHFCPAIHFYPALLCFPSLHFCPAPRTCPLLASVPSLPRNLDCPDSYSSVGAGHSQDSSSEAMQDFRKALSKFKAQSSNVSFTTFRWKETFELWALNFERAFRKFHHKWNLSRCLWYARGLCLCPCVITPRGCFSLPTQEAEYSFSGFIPTNKQTNKKMINKYSFGIGCIYSHPTSKGWHFRMLFQNPKLKAPTSLLPRFSEKKQLGFELWKRAFENSKSPWNEGSLYVLFICFHTNPFIVCECLEYLIFPGNSGLTNQTSVSDTCCNF